MTRYRTLRSAVVNATIALVLLGCGNKPDSRERPTAPGLRETIGVVQSNGGPIQRYARDFIDAVKNAGVSDFALPMDDAWTPHHGATIESTGDTLSIESAEKPAFVQLPLSVDAVLYDRVEIEMRTTAGTRCLFKWATDTAPDFARNPGVTEPIIADGRFHTYTINLDHYSLAEWSGRLQAIEFWPSQDASGDAEIREFRLLAAQHESPRRVTLVNQTHEAVFGSQPPWRVQVPEGGALSVHYGVLPDAAERYSSDGVTFRVTLPFLDGTGHYERAIDPLNVPDDQGWSSLIIDLEQYAGREIDIGFEVDGGANDLGDFAFWGSPTVFANATRDEAPPVILISLDTLRADHLSAYGYARETSPNIDQFAHDAVLFEHAIAAETWTLPSHMTMFTGLYPKNHGVTGNALLPESRLTLGDALSGAGYLTAGFTGLDWWLMPYRGFGQGFDFYNHARPTTRHIYATMPLAMNWLQTHDTNRFFLFFHAFDIHSKVHSIDSFQLPYETGDPAMNHFSKGMTPPSFERPGLETRATHYLQRGNEGKLTPTQDELDYMIAVYDDCIRMVDIKIGELFDSLRERGLYDKALIVLLSDHGESFFEHGQFLHQTVYEENCHVPLIVKLPDNEHAGMRIEHQVLLADVFPTIADVLDIETGTAEFDGFSLVPMIESGDAQHPLIYVQREEQRAIRTNHIKQIRYANKSDQECFDLDRDPNETAPNCDAIPEEAASLLAQAHDAFFTVPSAGWHIAFSNTNNEWETKMTFSSPDSRITNVAFLHADRRDETLVSSQGDRGFAATIPLKGAQEETCIVSVEQAGDRSTGGTADIDEETLEMLMNLGYGASEAKAMLATGSATVTIESNVPFYLNEAVEPVLSITEMLQPTAPKFAHEPATRDNLDRPHVRIWYSPPSENEHPGLTPEQAKRLGELTISD